ncbi:cryptochrome/photolyase family protein [Chitinophaga sancti]|uniref:cryptochrome/photolyase family protein n=1 Tax=Chitinophaga sancti TaxID=1004 RepID=UPI003F7AB1DA
MEVGLIYPHQLYKHYCHFPPHVYVVEDDLYFNQYNFHQQKILLHRASMQYYASRLKAGGHVVHYIEAQDQRAQTHHLFKYLAAHHVTTIHYADTTDYLLERRMQRCARRHQIRLNRYTSPNFIGDLSYFEQGNKYFMASYYKSERKRLQLLMNGNRPAGGKWSFDTENRKKMPANVAIPPLPIFHYDHFEVAQHYVQKHFGHNRGKITQFNYPVTHRQAERMLIFFLKEKLSHFGAYQDAIMKREHYLFHSILSSSLNIGLLSPQTIIQKTIRFGSRHRIPLNALEGFIRQVIGWREFMRAVYIKEGSKQRTMNFFGFTRKIPSCFYTGETGIPPIDNIIHSLLENAYVHHIERLMVLGNFMLLCEFDPNEVYQWFMEYFIDSYDWVMVPNVYGMSQFADGGMMSTKPYISSSNYILKMSDYKRGPWCEIWDALFWRFLHVHHELIKHNPRLSMLKIAPAKQRHYMEVAEKYLVRICEELQPTGK